MPTYPNARHTPIGREHQNQPHLDEGRSLAHLAADHGISQRTARKWLVRVGRGDGSADRRLARWFDL